MNRFSPALQCISVVFSLKQHEYIINPIGFQ